MRLIDADAFKKILSEKEMQHDKRRSFDEYSYGAAGAYEYAGELLDEQPTVELPHGKWEFFGNNLFKCTHCGYIADADYLRKWRVYTFEPEFPTACLKCGADMRKEGEAE